jgi:hypothetical protein
MASCHHRAERIGRDGGNAVVGNVTQYASVIVSDGDGLFF